MADKSVMIHLLCPNCSKGIFSFAGGDPIPGCPKRSCPVCGSVVYVRGFVEPAVKVFSERYSEYYMERALGVHIEETRAWVWIGWLISHIEWHYIWPFLLKIWWAFSPDSYQRWREKLAAKALFKALRDTGEVRDSFIRMSEADYVDWLAEHTEVPDWFLRRAEHIRKTGEWPEGELFASLVPGK